MGFWWQNYKILLTLFTFILIKCKIIKKEILLDGFLGLKRLRNLTGLTNDNTGLSENLALRVLFFDICELHDISRVWLWIKYMHFQYSSIEAANIIISKKPFSVLRNWKSGYISSLVAPVLSKTCSSLNLRNEYSLINIYLLHMMIFLKRWALQEQLY